MNVEEIMTRDVKSCRPGDSLFQAAQLMWDHDCGAIPVVNDVNEPIAMITDRDICMACFIQGRPPGELSVSSAMSSRVTSCRADEAISTAESLMRTQQIRRLPIIDKKGALVGILSLNDIATHAHQKKAGLHRDELGPDAIARTLSAICARPGMANAAE